jgi:hypothetical protein
MYERRPALINREAEPPMGFMIVSARWAGKGQGIDNQSGMGDPCELNYE